MDLFIVDFETYYDNEYSLTKMSTEDYVNDPRFEIILVGIKKNNEPSKWFSGTLEEIIDWLEAEGVFEGYVVAHHAMFDALILAVHAKRVPKMVGCTRMMANPTLKPFARSVSLDNCLKVIEAPMRKGTEVHNMKGRRRQSLSRQELQTYAEYCMLDCDGEHYLFKYLLPQIPRDELQVIDLTLRMYLEPRLQLDMNETATVLAHAKAKKEQYLRAVPPEITPQMLSSNPQFAQVLESLGVDVPMKTSPITGETTFAFAKTDTAWKELEEQYEDDPVVGPILMARVGAKSTIEESRAEKFLEISKRYGWFRVPLMYYAAHPGRYGGCEGLNAQNLPRIDKSRLRFAVKAPKGCVVLAADLAQIEARITAWLAKQLDLVLDFARGEDIYSKFATRLFRCETVKDRSPEDKKRRFVGKTCILGLGYGMGGPKLRTTLRKDKLKFTEAECKAMVDVYRSTYPKIPALWTALDHVIGVLAGQGGQRKLGPVGFVAGGIVLPNGMMIHYNNLRYVGAGTLGKAMRNYEGWVYDYAGETRTLWGGKICENIVQALARILIIQHMIEIKKQLKLRPVLQQHDELDYVAPESHAAIIAERIRMIMRTPPSWAPDLPVEVEIAYGPTLGDCK